MIGIDRKTEHDPGILASFHHYSRGQDFTPLFIQGDALAVLKQLPAESIDCCMTSPPYWNKRQYHNGGIGLEKDYKDKGFYFLLYHPKGSKPGDVWDILPEDTRKRSEHFAPYPEDLCKIPILATCPPDGIVLDPFCGTGTTTYVARILGRKSIGIDISDEYLELAGRRCKILIKPDDRNAITNRTTINTY